MKTNKFGIPAAALAALLATAAVAQEAGDNAPDQSMQNQDSMSGNMMGGGMSDMEGMHDMMQMMEKMAPMMEKMGPMMEACMEMMQEANETDAPAAEPQEG